MFSNSKKYTSTSSNLTDIIYNYFGVLRHLHAVARMGMHLWYTYARLRAVSN